MDGTINQAGSTPAVVDGLCRTGTDPGTCGFELCTTDFALPRIAVERLKGKIQASWHDRERDLDAHVIEAGRAGVVKVRIDLSDCGSPIGKMLTGKWETSVTIRALNADHCFWSCCVLEEFRLCNRKPFTEFFVDVPAEALRLCEPCAGTLFNVYVTVAARDYCDDYMPIVGYAEGGPILVYPTYPAEREIPKTENRAAVAA
jgi:hypothetical protein